MKNLGYIAATIICFIMLNSCAVTSGMSVGQLPKTTQTMTSFAAANGISYHVTELTAYNIPNTPATTTLRTPITLPPFSRYTSTDYRIAAGDLIDIRLPAYPEFTVSTTSGASIYANGYLVDQRGYLQFPMIGQVKAMGLTTRQLTSTLSAKLLKYLRYADPQVRVLSYRGNKFYIDGEVKTPGQFMIADQPVSIYTAIGMAGGIPSTADTENITLTRAGKVYHFGLKAMERLGYSPNQLMIQDSDVIRIGNITQNKVTVIGEFIRPSPVMITTDGISLAGVIGEVSGLDGRSANAKKVYVLREDPAQPHAYIYHLDLSTITNLSVANRFKMQPGDIVYVDPTGLVRWNRVISMLLPATSLTSVAKQF